MHRPSAESAFSITPNIPGKFQWDGNKISFLPDGSLSQDQQYTISINKTATDLAGKPIFPALSWQVMTISEPPVVVYPNPWIQGHTPGHIIFSNLPRKCSLNIFTMSGKLVASLVHQDITYGGSEEWDPSGMVSGFYLFQVKHPSGTLTGRFSIMK
jgi:hypothetical protein